jgi:hypothetical protein
MEGLEVLFVCGGLHLFAAVCAHSHVDFEVLLFDVLIQENLVAKSG